MRGQHLPSWLRLMNCSACARPIVSRAERRRLREAMALAGKPVPPVTVCAGYVGARPRCPRCISLPGGVQSR
jgi:hypothetical protein